MVRKYAKVSKRVSRGKRTYKRYSRYRRTAYKSLSRRISAVSKRVAGEVNKFESTPKLFQNNLLSRASDTSYNISIQSPLLQIQSGNPWVMPINWYYQAADTTIDTYTTKPFYNGTTQGIPANNSPVTVSLKQPIYYNVIEPGREVSTEYQYRLKYIYINALFNASASDSVNTDGALRIVIVKDKQPTGGAATWYDLNQSTNSRGVFNAQRIDAQLNPATVGRFKIMYDKTLKFTTTNGYKSFKYYKTLSTISRNNRTKAPQTPIYSSSNNFAQTNNESPPVQKNAYYLLIFSDGLNFTYTDESSTPANSFHLFNRVAYYNN